jgi:hypothetical protein
MAEIQVLITVIPRLCAIAVETENENDDPSDNENDDPSTSVFNSIAPFKCCKVFFFTCEYSELQRINILDINRQVYNS